MCGYHTAVVLGRRRLAWERSAVHQFQLEQSRRLHDPFDAGRIIHTRKLDQNFILARSAVFLDDNLSNAKLVDPVSNRIHGLIDRLFAKCLFLRRLQPHRVGVWHVALR